MPVYNGDDGLEGALDSLLAQTYEDFEIIISDNASTDGTEEICRRFSRLDPRVRYIRNDKNVGVARNYNRLFELSDRPLLQVGPARRSPCARSSSPDASRCSTPTATSPSWCPRRA